MNATTNTLANTITCFTPLRERFSIEIVYKPMILDNVTNLCDFGDDEHILEFITNLDVFEYASINEDEHESL